MMKHDIYITISVSIWNSNKIKQSFGLIFDLVNDNIDFKYLKFLDYLKESIKYFSISGHFAKFFSILEFKQNQTKT